MKFRLYFAVIVGCLFTHPTFAADLPTAMPSAPMLSEPVRGAPDWSGFYIGIDGGYGWGHDPSSMTFQPFGPPPFGQSGVLNSPNSKGYVLGGHAGYNWQRGMMVGGLEIDMSATGIKGTSSVSASLTSGFVGAATQSVSEKFDYLGSARGRLGFLPWQNVLLYGTGGLGWTRITQDMTSTNTTSGPFGSSFASTSSAPASLFGWVAGGGAEVILASVGATSVLARVEYLHYDFGSGFSSSNTQTFFNGVTNVTTTSGITSGRLTADVVRGGLTLKF